MDKQMIEEMANIIYKRVNTLEHFGLALFGLCEKIAEELLKHYQPKIPENAVVLTREEYERWQGQTLNIKKVRKETAEKFAEEVDKWKRKAIHYYNLAKSTGVYCIVDDDEICKEISEGE